MSKCFFVKGSKIQISYWKYWLNIYSQVPFRGFRGD